MATVGEVATLIVGGWLWTRRGTRYHC